tara:strand:- start:32 stop:211 length:180 start_codon:yes stop_codon:yes gene_type:complete
MPGHYDAFDEQNTEDAAGKKAKKRLPQPIRGVLNFLNEEEAAATENYSEIRKLKKKPKY